jgi:AcrR family transcriptional regulator
MGKQVVATDGRVIGHRAELTRRRLLDATARVLADRGALDLKVIDVTRRIGSSPATFYQYFEGVEDAILTLAAEAGADLAALSPLVSAEWDKKNGLAKVREFVGAFIEYWDEHKAILRIRNLRSEEGDSRFRNLRLAANKLTMDVFNDKVRAGQQAGRLSMELNADTTAGAMMAVLERMAAFHAGFEQRGVAPGDLIETVARILYQTLTGYKAT